MPSALVFDALAAAWFAGAAAALVVAWKKRRSVTLWPFFALLFGPVVLTILLALPDAAAEGETAAAGTGMGPATASREKRLAAALIDGLLFAVPGVLIGSRALPGPLAAVLALAALALAALQIVLLARDGQTLGKKALGLRVVLLKTGENGGFRANVLLRVLVQALLCAVPGYILADALFIFREDRRCLHDRLSGTVVIEESPLK
jgi:uncharacterized RDD family membrane protein YckC